MDNGTGRSAGGRTRVLVLFGGQSGEHDVSLRSAQTVMRALDPAKYEIVPVGITRDGQWLTGDDPMARLTADSPLFALGAGSSASGPQCWRPAAPSRAIPAVVTGQVDIVFPVLHGPMGEDGTIQGLLEMSGVPYVGSGVLGSAVAMDKAIAKTILTQAGLPQAPWIGVLRREWERDPSAVAERVVNEIGYPCFTKPANMGSSVGIMKVHGPKELATCMDEAARHDRKIVIERGIDARELEVSVLGNDAPIASIAGEIVPSREFYDYEAKYIDDDSELLIPAPIPDETMARVKELAVQAFRALDLAGMARVDFFLDRRSGELFVNEVNTIPGFTSISMYPMLWEASGLPLPALVDQLIALALERHADRRQRQVTGQSVRTYS